MSELLTAEQVADRLHLKPLTVRQWARRGRIPSIKISHKVTRFDWEQVVATLKRRAETAAERQAVHDD